MSDVFVGRQPICDRNQDVQAYELLYRSGFAGGANVGDGNAATATVAVNAVLELGLDQLVGSCSAFINVTRQFMVDGHFRGMPKGRVVLEVLEGIEPDAELVEAVRAASTEGYTIALDDFEYEEKFEPLIEIADLIKIDVAALSREEIERHCSLLNRNGIELLAEKVETHAEFEFCRDLGFKYFQGFYFCEPKVIQQKALPQNRLALLEILSKVHDSNVEIEELVETIVRDVSMSFRLLRNVNSSMFALPREIESVHQAVVMLGSRRIRSLCTLLMMATVDDKPRELTATGLVRARVCQKLAQSVGADDQMFFSVGLLSVLDALIDQPMAHLLDQMPLVDEVRAAILGLHGVAGEALRVAQSCERADWTALEESQFETDVIRDAYVDAMGWALEAMQFSGSEAVPSR